MQIIVNQGSSQTVTFSHYTAIVKLANGQVDTVNSTKLALTGLTPQLRVYSSRGGTQLLNLDARCVVSNNVVTATLQPSDTSGLTITSDTYAYYTLVLTNGTQTFRTYEGVFLIRK